MTITVDMTEAQLQQVRGLLKSVIADGRSYENLNGNDFVAAARNDLGWTGPKARAFQRKLGLERTCEQREAALMALATYQELV